MKKVVRLTESDLIRLVKRVLNEERDGYYTPEPSTKRQVVKQWYRYTDDSFYSEFLKKFPNKAKFDRMFSRYDSEFSDHDEKLEMFIHDMIGSIPNNGVDDIEKFMSDLEKVDW